jgi:hydroxyethylthiazole kinase-like uncharacterized protein yjeF
MKHVYKEVDSLDQRCYTQYGLSEDILMEHAANKIASFIEKRFEPNSKILIACGAGNNGADGIALARLLHGKYKVQIFLPFDSKSIMSKIQLTRTNLLAVPLINKLTNIRKSYDIVVDCLFGSGLSRELNQSAIDIIKKLNNTNGYKIACDIPSGINPNGKPSPICFDANTTITMGALKQSLFSDLAKEYVGSIKVANLGVQTNIYQDSTNCFLLEKSDIKLPFRDIQNTHKGTFGHLAVICGQKQGAAILAAQSGSVFGAGLTTLITKDKIKKLPYSLMKSDKLPSNTTVLCIGMGLGKKIKNIFIKNNIPKVIDADMFHNKKILKILNQENIVLTPHPKEFCSLLAICNLAIVDINMLQNDRFFYVNLFIQKYPNIVLLLKGANVLIGYQNKIYINKFGTSKLSKGGSGDILAGLIGSLLAQGYTPLEATISGSLAHTIAAAKYKKNNYSLTAEELIDQIKMI